MSLRTFKLFQFTASSGSFAGDPDALDEQSGSGAPYARVSTEDPARTDEALHRACGWLLF